MININSLDNKTVKELVRLRKANNRKEKGLFIIDGQREIQIALDSGVEIERLVFCPDFDFTKSGLLKLIPETKQIFVSANVFNKIAYKENPDGYLAVVKRSKLSLDEIKLSRKPLIIILESVEKPGNLGAIIRTAAAAGVDAIILNDNQTDLFNPNVIRASEGCVFITQIAVASFNETVAWLKSNNIKSFAASTKASINYTKVDFNGPSAIVLGTESDGLSEKWIKQADKKIVIPMKGDIDSLNVSVSAAIITFEAIRQRNIRIK